MQTKTAAELPAGAEVTYRGTVYVKTGPGRHEPWTCMLVPYTDGQIDGLLANGAFLTRVPAGASAPGKPYVFRCGCSPSAGIICGTHCQWQGCLQLPRDQHTEACIKGEREVEATVTTDKGQ